MMIWKMRAHLTRPLPGIAWLFLPTMAWAQNTPPSPGPRAATEETEVTQVARPESHLHVTLGAYNLKGGQTAFGNKRPTRFVFSQTTTLFEAVGEFSLGGGISYASADGPRTVAGAEKDVGFSSIGLHALADYRFAWTPTPPIAPRIGAGFGVERLAQQSVKSQGGTEVHEIDTIVKPIGTLKAALELSLIALDPGGLSGTRYGYGVRDFVLTLGGTIVRDFDAREYKLNGYSVEGGFGLLFE